VESAVYLSLGSNLGDRAGNLRKAIRRLESLGTVRAVSGFYETEPVEVEDEQPWFLNCAVLLETELSPQDLLAGALKLEQAMGRQRSVVRSARQIDIDILYFDDLVLAGPDLTIPHPGAARRKFVLAPLVEIAPDFRDPVTEQTANEMLAALPADAPIVRKWRG
jgi:2-amino-4-hydroxy-6-hydroxymethyldihydropteridine diphosphokinase